MRRETKGARWIMKQRESWQKDTFLAECLDRISPAGLIFYLALSAFVAGLIFLVSQSAGLTAFTVAVVLLFTAVGLANDVWHDMPRSGVRPFRSRGHTIIWRICQRGLMAFLVTMGVSAGNPEANATWQWAFYGLTIFMAFTWMDLFQYWWNSRAPKPLEPTTAEITRREALNPDARDRFLKRQ